MKARIKSKTLPWQKPYENLRPVVEALIRNGNKFSRPVGGHKPNRHGFYMDRDGWVCDFQNPISFELLRELFDFPPSIRIGESGNTISDDRSWSQIRGNIT